MRARRLVVAARIAEEDQRHQAGADEHGEADAERGRDDQAGVDLAVAARHQHDRDRGDDHRQQGEQPEDPPEALHGRLARARQRIGLRHGLPFGRAKWDYQATTSGSSLGRPTMTIASVLRDKGSAVETVTADTSVCRCRPPARREAHRRAAGGRGRADRRHHLRARRHLLPARPWRRDARLAGLPGDELAGDHRHSPIPTCSPLWR